MAVPLAKLALVALGILGLVAAAQAGESTVTIRVVDEAGAPVPGARLALQRDRYADGDEAGGLAFVNRWVGAMTEPSRADDGPTADADGRVVESRAKLIRAAHGRPLTFWAVDDPTGRVGITVVDADELPDEVTVALRPGVRLSARMGSASLRAAGMEPSNFRVWVRTPGDADLIVDDRDDPHFEAALPPGDYRLLLNIAGTYLDVRDVTLRPGEPVHVEADLAARRIHALVGGPAPALAGIAEWRNAPAAGLALDDLRGKVVLLNFWATWCGICVAEMPALTDLHAEFAGDDFELIAVHDATEPSFDAAFEKLGDAVRDLPFPLALDSGGEVQIPGAPDGTRTAGRTNAAYGVDSYPTGVVVGRDGTVLRTFDVRDEADVEWLRGLVRGG